MKKRTSEEWQKKYPSPKVIDPDGWHRDERFDYEWYRELITKGEYKQRVLFSTCGFYGGIIELMTQKQIDELIMAKGEGMKLPIHTSEHGTPYILLSDIPTKFRQEFDEWFGGQTGIMLIDGSLGVYPWDWDNFLAHIEGRPEFWD